MCDVWHVMCDVWHVMCDVWHVMCDVWHVMCDVWHVMCDVWHVMARPVRVRAHLKVTEPAQVVEHAWNIWLEGGEGQLMPSLPLRCCCSCC